MLTKDIEGFADNFKSKKIANKKLAVFMREKNGIYFYGVYKSLLVNENRRLCLYHRIDKTLDTKDWV